MEYEEQNGEKRCSRLPFLPRLQTPNPPPIPAFLGLLFVLASLSHIRPPSFKPVSTAIKLADAAIKGTRLLRVLHSPSTESLILASKALVKGYKVSKRLNPSEYHHKISSIVAAKLKACIGALNLLRHANSPFIADGFLGLGFLKGGYKVSKNSAKVLEGFVGLQLNSAFRDGIDALGLLVKAAAVGIEITRWLSIEQCPRNQPDCLFLRGELRVGVHLSCKTLHFDGFHMRARAFPAKKFSSLEKSEIDEMDLGLYVSELLCLSIPANKAYKLTCSLSSSRSQRLTFSCYKGSLLYALYTDSTRLFHHDVMLRVEIMIKQEENLVVLTSVSWPFIYSMEDSRVKLYFKEFTVLMCARMSEGSIMSSSSFTITYKNMQQYVIKVCKCSHSTNKGQRSLN